MKNERRHQPKTPKATKNDINQKLQKIQKIPSLGHDPDSQQKKHGSYDMTQIHMCTQNFYPHRIPRKMMRRMHLETSKHICVRKLRIKHVNTTSTKKQYFGVFG